MNIKNLLAKGKNELKQVSNTPFLDSEILLSKVINSSKEYLIAHSNEEMPKASENFFWRLIQRRKNYEPISQIINKKEFFGLDFYINKNVLTPRPETEILVENVLKTVKNWQTCTIVDIGTGSGCIAIACAKNVDKNIKIIALDKCKKALNVAIKNAEINNVKIDFIQSDLLNEIKRRKITKPYIFAVNLPYVADKDLLPKEVSQYEPKKALFAGKNGMDLYEKLFYQISKLFNDFYQIVFECDPSQKSDFEKLKDKYFKNKTLTFYQDLSKKIRGGIIE